MPRTETPVLPEWNESLALPPTYEDYLKRREEEEAQQKAQDGNE